MAKNSPDSEAPKNPNKDVGGMKYVARLIGGVGGLVALALGAWTCVTITPRTMLAGIWQMLLAFSVVLIEAPCLCMCIECVGKISDFFDRKAFWLRSLLYVPFSIMPVVLSPQINTIIGSGFIFATGVVYGVISLGRKGSRSQMQSNASSESMKDSLISNEKTQIP